MCVCVCLIFYFYFKNFEINKFNFDTLVVYIQNDVECL